MDTSPRSALERMVDNIVPLASGYQSEGAVSSSSGGSPCHSGGRHASTGSDTGVGSLSGSSPVSEDQAVCAPPPELQKWAMLCPQAEQAQINGHPGLSPTDHNDVPPMRVMELQHIEPSAKRSVEEVLHLSLSMIDSQVGDWPSPGVLTSSAGPLTSSAGPLTSSSTGSCSATESGAPMAAAPMSSKPVPLPIPVWPATLPISCQDLKAELHLSKLYSAGDSKLDPRAQSVVWQGVWMTPREFEVQSGRKKHKNWKYSVRFNGRPVREVLCDIEKAFSLGYSREVVFSGSKPPAIGPMSPWPTNIAQKGRLNFQELRLPAGNTQPTRPIDAGGMVNAAGPDSSVLGTLARSPPTARTPPGNGLSPLGIEQQLVESLLATMRGNLESAARMVVRTMLTELDAERQRLKLENDSLRKRLSQMDIDLQAQRSHVTKVKSLLTTIASNGQ